MPRRGDNIRKRKDGRWEARYPNPNREAGESKYCSVYGRTYQEVKEKRDRIIQLQNSAPQIGSIRCFKEIIAAWQDSNRIRLKESSVSRYQNLIDAHIMPELGNCRMDRLNATTLNSFIGRKLKKGRLDGKGGLSPSYVRSIALVIDAAIKYGASEKLCSPLQSAITKPTVAKQEISVLSRATQAQLEKTLLTDMTEEKLLIYITLYTGLRIGEVLALRWEDMDWSNKILYVRHTVTRVWYEDDGKKYSVLIVAAPKTETSLRLIPICSKLFDILSKFPYKKGAGFILARKGNFVSPRTFEYRYKKILKEGGIEQINYHTLRHTFATRCIESDVDIKSLSEVLGHADSSITLNTYVHSSIELKRTQLEKIV